MKTRGLLAVIIVISGSAEAFNESDSLRSTYIHSYSDFFFLGPLLERDNLEFELVSANDVRRNYAFKTNAPVSLGANINLFDVNLRLSFSTPLGRQSRYIFGTSDVRDIQLTAITRKWFADAFYQRYDGYYIESSDDLIPAGQPYPRRDDVETKNFGAAFTYIFKHNQFSLRAPYLFSERQKISKGSFLISSVLSTFSIQADSALIPADRRATWGAGAEINQIRFTSLGLAPGYSHTFVLDDFFLNLTLSVGPAHYWVRRKEETKSAIDDIRIDAFSLGRVGVGYNGDRFFVGLSITSQSRNLSYEQVTLQNGSGTFRIVTGYRFREEGLLKKRATDLINH